MAAILDLFKHLPEHLQAWAASYGAGFYFIVGAIIFAETGLVVTPLLPGDSLLFATGAILATGVPGINLPCMCIALIVAAILGDLVNYHIGRWAAPKLFGNARLKWLNPRHLEKTKAFYARHGGKTVVLARFLPIVRTYAPFVAGVGALSLPRFLSFSIVGGTLWIVTFLNLGFYFGNIPTVKANFELVIIAIVGISLAPVAIEFLRHRAGSSNASNKNPLASRPSNS